MKHSRRSRPSAVVRLALVLAAGLLGAGVAMPPGALAQRTPPPTRPPKGPPNLPVVNSWALAPTGTNPAEPSSRVYLSYDAAQGGVVRDSVTLWNYSNVQLTFQIYPTDAFNNRDGAFELLEGSKKPADAGAWVTLPQANVTAAAHSKIDLPFTLTVPADARPGDHAGAILAASKTTGTAPDGKVVVLDRRTGSRMYVRVGGPIQPGLTVESTHTVYHPALNPLGGKLDVTYTVRNTGNVRLAAHQRVAVSGPFGLARKSRTPKDVPELLPNNALTLRSTFTGVPALIRANADIRLDPFSPAPDVKNVPSVRRGGHTWAMPWSLVALAIAVWLARRSYLAIQQRRRLLAQTSGSPPAPRSA